MNTMELKQNVRFLLILSILISTSGCEMLQKCGECFTPPQPIMMKIVNSEGENLITNGLFNKDSLKIYYFDNQVKKNVSFEVAPLSDYTNTIYCSEMAWLSVDKKIDFYLYLNHLDIDTLSLELRKHSEDCCTSHPIRSFDINGKPAVMSNVDYAFLIKK